MRGTEGPTAPYRPWFLRHPRWAALGTLLLFVAITVARIALGPDTDEAVMVLYVIPIGLAGLAWGRWAGMGLALVAIVLMGLWVLVEDVGLSPVGWVSRVVPLLLTGLVLGDASERLHRAEEAQLRYEAQALQRQQAIEVNDHLVQGMAAAKWALEAGHHDAGLQALDRTLDSGQRLVSQLIRDAGMGIGGPGDGSGPDLGRDQGPAGWGG